MEECCENFFPLKIQLGAKPEHNVLQVLANWREAIHSFLSNTLKLDPELMRMMCMSSFQELAK